MPSVLIVFFIPFTQRYAMISSSEWPVDLFIKNDKQISSSQKHVVNHDSDGASFTQNMTFYLYQMASKSV